MTEPLAGDPFSGGPGLDGIEPSRVSALTAWIMTALTAVALTVAIVGRLFPLVVVLDLVSLWPLPALGVLLVIAGRWLPRSVRLAAPALLVSWLILGVAWWSVGTPEPPSAAADVLGPAEVPAHVALAVAVDGDLSIVGGAERLYEVSLGQRGGSAGAPDVLEARDGDVLAMAIEERDDSGWFRTSGWDMRLDDGPIWAMDLRAQLVDLDLRTLRLGSLVVEGDGTVVLPRVATVTEAVVSGDVVVSVPADMPVRVIGVATVPASWATDDEGASAPVDGEGWVLVVEGPGVEVVDR